LPFRTKKGALLCLVSGIIAHKKTKVNLFSTISMHVILTKKFLVFSAKITNFYFVFSLAFSTKK